MKPKYGEERSKEVKEFLKELSEVCVRHNLSLAHEDSTGNFTVVNFDQCYVDWLKLSSEQRMGK